MCGSANTSTAYVNVHSCSNSLDIIIILSLIGPQCSAGCGLEGKCEIVIFNKLNLKEKALLCCL